MHDANVKVTYSTMSNVISFSSPPPLFLPKCIWHVICYSNFVTVMSESNVTGMKSYTNSYL